MYRELRTLRAKWAAGEATAEEVARCLELALLSLGS